MSELESVKRFKRQMAYHAKLKEWHSEKFDQPLAREILTKLGITPALTPIMELKLTPFGIVVSIKEEEEREKRRKALGLTEPQTDSVNFETQIAPPLLLVAGTELLPCKTCGCLTGFEDPHPEGDGPVVWCCNTLCCDCHTVFTVEEWNAR